MDDTRSDKGILNLNKEHKFDANLVQSQSKVMPENHSHSSIRSSPQIFKSFLPTIYGDYYQFFCLKKKFFIHIKFKLIYMYFNWTLSIEQWQ